MAEMVEGPCKSFQAGGALSRFIRVVLNSSSLLAAAGELDDEIGMTEKATFASGDWVAVRLKSAQGTQKYVANGAITKGAKVYGAAAGKVSSTANGNYKGYANIAAAADGDIIEVVPVKPSQGKAYTNVAASAAVTNLTAETAFDKSYSIPANSLNVGDVIKIRLFGIATATNSTDTLNVKLKIGSTIIMATGALDVANNDEFHIDVMLVVRTIGASGTIVGAGFNHIGIPGTATVKAGSLASTTLDTTAAAAITGTATWSVANAGNSCRLDILNVEIVRA